MASGYADTPVNSTPIDVDEDTIIERAVCILKLKNAFWFLN